MKGICRDGESSAVLDPGGDELECVTLGGGFDTFSVLPAKRGSGVAGLVQGWVIQMPAQSPKGCGGIMRRLLLVVVILLICAGAAAAQQTSGSASPATETRSEER